MAKSLGFCLGLAGLTVLPEGVRAQVVFYDDVDNVHPGYTLTNLHSPDFKPQVADLDWLPDGRLVVLCIKPDGQNFTGAPQRNGLLYVLAHPQLGQEKEVRTELDTLVEAVGVEVVDGRIYVAEKRQLVEYTLDAATRVSQKRVLATIPHDPDGPVNFQEYPFGLLYRDGYFYTANAGAVTMGGWSFARNPDTLKDPYSGGVLRISRADGSLKLLNGGLRACNGITFGPDSSIWVTDNQGSWLPSSKLIAVEPGRNYGYPNGPNGFRELAETWPAVWLPHGEIARSPTHPAFLNQGPYRGQFLIGDISKGGIKRAFVEKVRGEWQGAVFSFTGGLAAGVQKILPGRSGEFIVGGLGQGDFQNWGWNGKTFALQVLSPKPDDSTFEMLAVRARRGGLEIEFTQPLARGSESALEWTVEAAQMEPDESYGGGNMLRRAPLPLTEIRLSESRRCLYLGLQDLMPKRVLVVKASPQVMSQSGRKLRCPAAWYTWIQAGESEPFSLPAPLLTGSARRDASLRWTSQHELAVKTTEPAQVTVYTPSGQALGRFEGGADFRIDLSQWRGRGLLLVALRARGRPLEAMRVVL